MVSASAIASPAASPEADDLAVAWEAPAECGSARDLEAGIRGWLGDVRLEGTPEVHGRVIRGADATWQLDVRVESRDGVREQRATAAQCRDLLETAALIAATQLEPVAVARQLPESVRSPPDTVPEPDAAAPESDTAAPPPAARDEGRLSKPAELDRASNPIINARAPNDFHIPSGTGASRVGGGLRIEGGFGLGIMVVPAGRVGLAGGLTRRALRVELAGFYETPQTIAHRSIPGASIRSQAFGGQLLGCGVPRAGKFEFPLCGGLELAAVAGRGLGVDAARNGVLPWFAVALSASAVWRPLPALGIWLSAAGGISVVRPVFELSDGTQAGAGAGAIRGLMGLEWRIR
jgi:hypothetical protein